MRVIFGNNIERVIINDEGVLLKQFSINDEEWHDDLPIMGLERHTILFLIDVIDDMKWEINNLEDQLYD